MTEHIREMMTTATVAAMLAVLLPAPAAAQGPPPELLLSSANNMYITAEDKRQTGDGDPAGDYREAIRYFNLYLEAVPEITTADSASIMFYLADSHFHLQAWAEAAAYYEWLFDRDPEAFRTPDNIRIFGYILWQLKGEEDALPWYQEYVELVPNDLATRKLVAQTLWSQGQLAESLPHWMIILEETPEDADAVTALLNLRTRLPAEYERVTRHLAEMLPETAQYLLALGQHFMIRGDTSQGVAFIRQYVEKQPDSVRGWTQLAEAYRKAGQNDQALEALRRIKTLEPRDIKARSVIAEILLDQGRLDQAIDELKGALAIDANDPHANAIMGDAAREWGIRWLQRNHPGSELEKMPYNLKVFFKDVVVERYYNKARNDPVWRNHATTYINYLSQFYPQSQDVFMATDEEKVPIPFPPSGRE